MKKTFLGLFIFIFINSNSYAGTEGYGELKLNDLVVEYFKKYLSTTEVQNSKVFNKTGRGWYFAVAQSGEEFGYRYCPKSEVCIQNPAGAKQDCQKNVKKYLKRKEKCSTFAKQRTIVWGGKNIKIKRNASNAEVDAILKEHGFIN